MEFLLQLVPYAIVVILLIIPIVKILRRIGLAPAWSLIILLPGFGIMILVWLIAYRRWPAIDPPPISR